MTIYCVYDYIDNSLIAIFMDERDAKDYAEDIYYIEEYEVNGSSRPNS